jgi:uncharacterized protein (TIGR02391 family)
VLVFVTHAMNPLRHVGNRDYFESERAKLNSVLSFSGLVLGEDGNLKIVTAARTLSESEAMAGALRKALIERKVHADVLKFCRAELLVENYFHAVFEAAKSVAEKLRQKTGLGSDGSLLVEEALSLGKAGCPRLAFNSLTTESERNEQSGLANIIKGLFGAFRHREAPQTEAGSIVHLRQRPSASAEYAARPLAPSHAVAASTSAWCESLAVVETNSAIKLPTLPSNTKGASSRLSIVAW